MNTEPDLIGAGEAARILDVTRPHLTRIVRAGVLVPVVKLEGRTGAYLFDRATVDELRATRDKTRAAP